MMLFIFSLLFGAATNAQWLTQQSGTISPLRSVSILDQNNVIISGDNGTILQTTEGGDSWMIKNIAAAGTYLFASEYINKNDIVITGSGGNIFRSSDGGEMWVNINSATQASLYSLDFLDSLTGIAAGQNGTILKTIDGGLSWQQLNSGTQNFIYAVCFQDQNTVYAAGGSGLAGSGIILKTSNGGTSWDVKLNPLSGNLYSIDFTDANTGYACGDAGKLYRTTDAGESWDLISEGGMVLTSLDFHSNLNGYVTAGNEIRYTSDGGQSWSVQFSDTNYFFTNIKFFNSNVGYAVDHDGLVVKTNNGGGIISGIENNNSETGDYRLNQNYPNPFNPSTTIEFAVPRDEHVSLKMYDMLSRAVLVLIDEIRQAGSYKVNVNAAGLASGVYYYTLQAGRLIQTKKLIIMK